MSPHLTATQERPINPPFGLPAACSADLTGLTRLPESLVSARASVVLEEMLSRGFTTVRDCGGADHGLAAAVEEGTLLGPRVLFTGHALSQTGGHGDFRGAGDDCLACGAALRGIWRVCDGDAEVRRAVRCVWWGVCCM